MKYFCTNYKRVDATHYIDSIQIYLGIRSYKISFTNIDIKITIIIIFKKKRNRITYKYKTVKINNKTNKTLKVIKLYLTASKTAK